MSFHINYQGVICKKCSASFIPFRENLVCPSCKAPADDYYDFIRATIDAMKMHKQKYGSFMPSAWYVGCLSDHIQSLIFRTFDTLEDQKPQEPKKFLADLVNNIKFEDQAYLKGHIRDMVLAIYDVYQSESLDKIKYKPPKWPMLKALKKLLMAFNP